jgi:hypothetical protein
MQKKRRDVERKEEKEGEQTQRAAGMRGSSRDFKAAGYRRRNATCWSTFTQANDIAGWNDIT